MKRPLTSPVFYSVLTGIALFCGMILSPGLSLAKPAKKIVYRQPAYISNAYFSDTIAREGKNIEPITVMKALQPRRADEEVGYFILDLILTMPGRHEFKVSILDKSGDKVSELNYPLVKAPKDIDQPLYTAVGSISEKIGPGLWFFKVYDRVNKGTWYRLGIFAITVLPADKDN
jgi:hypothetical protein